MGESNSVVQTGPPLLLQMADGCLGSTPSASSQMCSLGDNVWQRAGHLAPVCAFSSCWQSQLSLPEHIPVMFTSSIPEQFQIKYLPAETNYVDHHSLAMRRLLTNNKDISPSQGWPEKLIKRWRQIENLPWPSHLKRLRSCWFCIVAHLLEALGSI